MSHTGHQHTIVVGFDGSPGALASLDWAADEAGRRGADLCVIRAWGYPDYGELDDQWDLAQAALSEEVGHALDRGGDVRWQAMALKGVPAKVLVEHSADADLLVVGSRGHGGFAGLLLGSVAHQVSTHATVPVVIVRRPPVSD